MKIAKGIASVLKTIGLVVMAIAIVMSIYVVANDGAGWSTLSGALRSYQQNASVVTRAWFDKQYFSAMIDAASTKTLGGDVRQNRALTFYTTWVSPWHWEERSRSRSRFLPHALPLVQAEAGCFLR